MANVAYRWLGCALPLILSFSVTGCAAPRSTPVDEVDLGTDSASAPLTEGLLNAFEGSYPDTAFSIRQDSRQAILDAVESNELDAAILFWPLQDRSLFATPIAEQPLLLIVDHSNPLDGIGLHEARSVLAGRIANWEELGGVDLPITLITYPSDNSTRIALEVMLLDVIPMAPAAQIVSDEASALSIMAASAGSLAYIPYSSLTPDVKPITIEGAPPTLTAARQRSYPLIGQVVFVCKEEPHGFIREFLQWILSHSGQQVVHRYMLGYSN